MAESDRRMTPGYFGVGIEAGKSPDNLGALWRSAHAFGAAYIFTIGARYPLDRMDTTKAERHIPLFEFDSVDEFSRGRGCEIIGIECGQGTPKPLPDFTHPQCAAYVLGAEDRGLSDAMLERCDWLVEIPTAYCLNVATTGALVMYDRSVKAQERA